MQSGNLDEKRVTRIENTLIKEKKGWPQSD